MSFDLSVFASFVHCLSSIFVYLIKICYSFVFFLWICMHVEPKIQLFTTYLSNLLKVEYAHLLKFVLMF